MKTRAILAAVVLCASVAGCDLGQPGSVANPAPMNTTQVELGDGVTRTGPDEFGVVCYVRHSTTFSCVKVKP